MARSRTDYQDAPMVLPGFYGDVPAAPVRPAVAVKSPRQEQAEQLARVSGRLAEPVAGFVRAHIGQMFHAHELCDQLAMDGYLAPESAMRVMRDLRARGVINYRVVDRSQSLYEALPVEGRNR